MVTVVELLLLFLVVATCSGGPMSYSSVISSEPTGFGRQNMVQEFAFAMETMANQVHF